MAKNAKEQCTEIITSREKPVQGHRHPEECSKFQSYKLCCLEPRAEEEGSGENELQRSCIHILLQELMKVYLFPKDKDIHKEMFTNILV